MSDTEIPHRWPRVHWKTPKRHRWHMPIIATGANPQPSTAIRLNYYRTHGQIIGLWVTRKGRERYWSWVWPVYIVVGSERRLRWFSDGTP